MPWTGIGATRTAEIVAKVVLLARDDRSRNRRSSNNWSDSACDAGVPKPVRGSPAGSVYRRGRGMEFTSPARAGMTMGWAIRQRAHQL